MITKIKIDSATKSDVISMTMRGGWKVHIYRNPDDEKKDFVTVTRDPHRFHMYIDDNCIVIDRYFDGRKMDTKRFHDTGSGINGLLFISENPISNLTYAYFRTEQLQSIMDDFDIVRVEIAKEPGVTFDKTIEYITLNGMPHFHTDGTYELRENPDDPNRSEWLIGGATYIWDYENRRLHIPQVFDHRALRQKLQEIVDS